MLKRLLITGAAGGIGQEMRNRLSHMAEIIRVSDKAALGDAGANEEVMECNLADRDAVFKLVQGCDGILHLGGISIEDSWTPIKDGNIDGIVNLYEAARLLGQPRIIFASTNHTVGFYRQNERIDSKVYPQPIVFMVHQRCLARRLPMSIIVNLA
jgi:uronate dehydrogenase